MLYILAHAYKHYDNSGTGLRSLLDIYVILKESSLDMSKVSAELEKLGMTDFESRFRSLSLDLFSEGKLTEDEMEMLAYMVSSGIYGTVQNSVETISAKQVVVREANGGIFSTGFSRPWNKSNPAIPFFTGTRSCCRSCFPTVCCVLCSNAARV